MRKFCAFVVASVLAFTVAACDPWTPPARAELAGNIATSHDGQVIEDFNLNGTIRIEHDNVTLRRFKVTSQGGPAIYNLNHANLVVEDCELDGQGVSAASAIAEHNYTMRRCYVHDHGEGPRINGNVTIEDSIIVVDDSFIAQGAHQDGIQATSGHNITLRRNVVMMHVDGGNAAVFFGSYPGGDVLIEDNIIGGGSYALAVDNNQYTNVTIRNNRFAHVWPNSGWFAPISLGGVHPVTLYGNVWHDDPGAGQPIS